LHLGKPVNECYGDVSTVIANRKVHAALLPWSGHRSRRCKFENDSAANGACRLVTAPSSCTVEVASCVHGQSVPRRCPVFSSCETVQNGFFPSHIELKYHSTRVAVTIPVCAAEDRRAIQVPGLVHHERTRLRPLAVSTIRERAKYIEHTLGPASVWMGRQLENHATATTPAFRVAAPLRIAV
jgi:hypothetical protein